MAGTQSTPLLLDTKDSKGFLPPEKAKSESETAAFYVKMISFCLFVGLALATGTYFAVWYFLPIQAKMIEKKLAFVREYNLGYVYVGWLVCYLSKVYSTINASMARAPARVDRPDQHVYQIMADSGPLSNAPFVMMMNDGVIGRFNRAQRASANLDESLPIFITGFVLHSPVFGAITTLPIALIYAFGVYKFSNDYKINATKRSTGFTILVLAYYLNFSFVLLVAALTLSL
eukprot:jgi/Bigna1/146298/aug1.112_g21006